MMMLDRDRRMRPLLRKHLQGGNSISLLGRRGRFRFPISTGIEHQDNMLLGEAFYVRTTNASRGLSMRA